MTKVYLGLDTSCYTTSLAAVDGQGSLICQVRKLLPVPAGENGLRQSQALFEHIKQLPALYRQLLAGLPKDHKTQAVCVSTRPRPAHGSYMPVFLAGESFADVIAAGCGAKLLATTHQHGHVYAALYGAGGPEGEAFLAVHLSGGTSELLRVRRLEDDLDIELLGGTLDASAGQLVDRVGVKMGLPFPAGAHLEEMAFIHGVDEPAIPASAKGLSVSFSGAQSAALRALEAGEDKPKVAAMVFSALSRTLGKWIAAAVEETGIKAVLLMGGVASSTWVRRALTERLAKQKADAALHFAPAQYCSDNAVGVALSGFYQMRRNA
ncbi:MAG: O-sialoglycoprotein endopeptidase [Christensenellales bacterium]